MQSSNEIIRSAMERIRAMVPDAGDPRYQAQVAAFDAQLREQDNASAAKNREAKWTSRRIPARLWPMLHASALGSEGGPTSSPALCAVGSFLSPRDEAQILVLAGGVGTGKTMAAAWGCAFHGGLMCKAMEIVKAGLFDSLEVAPQQFHLMAIDDLGMEPVDAKGYGYAAIFDLLDERYDSGQKTILTTNLTMDDFRARYGSGAGARMWDRIREVGRWVDVPGESMRRTQA